MTALFNVLAPLEGRQGAYEVVKTIFQRVEPLSMNWLHQSGDLARCEGDRFGNFKQFHLEMFDNRQSLFPNSHTDEGDLLTTVTRCGRFRRPTTIAKGGDVCSFRFYRKGTAAATDEIDGAPVEWTDALNRSDRARPKVEVGAVRSGRARRPRRARHPAEVRY